MAALLGASCGGDLPLPRVETAGSAVTRACADTIARVFEQAGFVPVSMLDGPPMLFAPRTTAPLGFAMTLGWAVGVSFPPGGGACNFRLQALSIEPECVSLPCIAPGVRSSLGTIDPVRANSLAPPDRACYGITPTCPLSPVGGAQYADALKELARRIAAGLAHAGAD